MPNANRPRRVRRLLLTVGVVALLAGSWLGLRKFVPVNFFDREAANADELAVLSAAPLTSGPPTDAGSWPQWLGPSRDGHAPAGSLRGDWSKDPPKRLWSVPVGGGYSSFAVVGGRAYTLDKQGDSERLVCLDAATGATAWTFAYPADYKGIGFGNGPRATPTVHDGKVYAVGATGLFHCLKPPARDGQAPAVLWKHDMLAEFDAAKPDFGVAGSPLIDGDLVVVQPGGKGGTLAAFDRVSGELRWKSGRGPWSYSSPVVTTAAGVRQIVAATGDAIVGVRADDGKELWRHPWVTQFQCNIATPITVGDYVFVSSGYNKGCVLLRLKPEDDGVSAEQVYFRSNRVLRTHFSTSVYRDGFLYGFDDPLGFRCVYLRKGEAVEDWDARDADNKAFLKGCAILAGDKLIGLTTTGTVFLADADPTEFRFRGKLDGVLSGGECWSLPVLVDGRLYLRDAEKAVCLDVK